MKKAAQILLIFAVMVALSACMSGTTQQTKQPAASTNAVPDTSDNAAINQEAAMDNAVEPGTPDSTTMPPVGDSSNTEATGGQILNQEANTSPNSTSGSAASPDDSGATPDEPEVIEDITNEAMPN